MLDLKRFGEILKENRTNKKIKQKKLANLLYVTPQAVSKWERGLSFPDIETLVKLCYHLEISIDYVLNECSDRYQLAKEVTIDNIPELLNTPKRKELINHITYRKKYNIDILDIFYLLNTHERLNIINLTRNKEIEIDYKRLIVLLSPAERLKLISQLDLDIYTEIKHLLSTLEKSIYHRRRESNEC